MAMRTVIAKEANVSTSRVRLKLNAGSVIFGAEILLELKSDALSISRGKLAELTATPESLEKQLKTQFIKDHIGYETLAVAEITDPPV